MSLPLNGCLICVYTNCRKLRVPRITGIYFSPTVKPNEMQVKMLTDRGSRRVYEGMELGHVIGGDFNHPSWQVEYGRWIANGGIWTLTDPDRATPASGNSLDKFLYVPGAEVPPSFLTEQAVEEGDEDEGEEGCYYPGATGPTQEAGNRHPILLSIPYGRERRPPFVSKVRVQGLSEEDWHRRNTAVGQQLVADQAVITEHLIRGNATKAHGVISGIIRKKPRDLYTRKPKRGRDGATLDDPFALFCQQNRAHPRLLDLRIAHYAERHGEEEKLLRLIHTEG